MGDSNSGGTITVDNGNGGGGGGAIEGELVVQSRCAARDHGEQRRRNGRQDGRASVAGHGDGVSPSSRC